MAHMEPRGTLASTIAFHAGERGHFTGGARPRVSGLEPAGEMRPYDPGRRPGGGSAGAHTRTGVLAAGVRGDIGPTGERAEGDVASPRATPKSDDSDDASKEPRLDIAYDRVVGQMEGLFSTETGTLRAALTTFARVLLAG